MEMHLPGGSSWFAEFFQDHHTASTGDTDVVGDVSAEQLTDALEAMRRGDVEFVTLIDGDEFAQAAGDGDGPYLLEHHGADGAVAEVSTATFATVSTVLGGYRSGDETWRAVLAAPAPAAPTSAGSPSGTDPEDGGGGLLSRFRRRR